MSTCKTYYFLGSLQDKQYQSFYIYSAEKQIDVNKL